LVLSGPTRHQTRAAQGIDDAVEEVEIFGGLARAHAPGLVANLEERLVGAKLIPREFVGTEPEDAGLA
jgi:hypothetical protein